MRRKYPAGMMGSLSKKTAEAGGITAVSFSACFIGGGYVRMFAGDRIQKAEVVCCMIAVFLYFG